MVTSSPAPTAPDAVDAELTARRLEAVDRLVEIGMALAEAMLRQAREPDAPRVFTGDLALAFSRIARAVRLTVLLAQRLEDGLPALAAQGAGAEADDAAAQAEPVERLDEGEDAPDAERGERGDREADERVWLTRPISALAAQICRDLDAPYDRTLWGDDIPGPYPCSARPRESGDPGVLSSGALASGKSLGPRFRGDERGFVGAGESPGFGVLAGAQNPLPEGREKGPP